MCRHLLCSDEIGNKGVLHVHLVEKCLLVVDTVNKCRLDGRAVLKLGHHANRTQRQNRASVVAMCRSFVSVSTLLKIRQQMPPRWAQRAQSAGSSDGFPKWVARSRGLQRPSFAVQPAVAERHCEPRAWTPDTLAHKLERVALPQWWKHLFAEVMAEAWVSPSIFGTEIFSGCEALSEAFRTHVEP